jgi:lipoprotein-anchoring transpeptidase ErfK/SrfK
MQRILVLVGLSFLISSCATTVNYQSQHVAEPRGYTATDFSARLPQHLDTGNETAVLVDPNVHAWGAYDSSGNLIRGGEASAGSNWCPDLGRPCHTHPGTYRVNSLGSPGCKSSQFPIPRGGAPMPYCMFFDRNQALHGSPDHEVVDGNISHGCVRMHVQDAAWLRYNFVNVGTKVIVRPY